MKKLNFNPYPVFLLFFCLIIFSCGQNKESNVKEIDLVASKEVKKTESNIIPIVKVELPIKTPLARLAEEPILNKYYKNLKITIDTTKHSQSYQSLQNSKIKSYYYYDYHVVISANNKRLFSKMYAGHLGGEQISEEAGGGPRSGIVDMDAIYDFFLERKSETELLDISLNATFEQLGQSALKRISDQSILDDIAKNAKTENVRKYALERQKTLADLKTDTFKDLRDGKIYKTVKIGNQWIMSENLAYKPKKGKCWSLENNPSKYGYFYNWEAAMSTAPPGWHLPSKDEWFTLYKYLGGNENKAFTEMLENGKSGFNAKLYGTCGSSGKFFNKGFIAQFWSSSTGKSLSSYSDDVWTFFFNTNFQLARPDGGNSSSGYSVRLFRD